jgi:hypothetical protein
MDRFTPFLRKIRQAGTSAPFLDTATPRLMTQALEAARLSSDPKAVAILAKNIYREFRAGGFNERDVMALAGELLELVASDFRNERAIREG